MYLGTVDVRTGVQQSNGFFPDMKKQRGLCENVAHIRTAIANYPAKSRFVYCMTKYEKKGSELSIERSCKMQLVPVKDHCLVVNGELKLCYCNSELCNNKVWDEESGMNAVAVDPVVPVPLFSPSKNDGLGGEGVGTKSAVIQPAVKPPVDDRTGDLRLQTKSV